MQPLQVVIGSRRFGLGPDRAWCVCYEHGLQVLAEEELAGREVLATFVFAGGWFLAPGAAPASLLVDGAPLDGRTTPVDHATVRLSLAPAEVGARAAPPEMPRPFHPEVKELVIGRSGGPADLQVDDPAVSSSHAVITLSDADGLMIRADRGRVFVNDRAMSSAPVGPDDKLIIGQTVLDGTTLRRDFDLATSGGERSRSGHGLSVRANGLSVRNGKQLTLTGISFTIEPDSLTVIVGPSGAGKSTLMGAMLGGRTISEGALRIEDIELVPRRRNGPLLQLVRWVPQEDSLFDDLTVRETLEGAARLRLARDTPAGDRQRQIDSVLTDLDLGRRRDVKVGRLSGGERRRVSIGTELVGRPRMLLLDEPSSGLDLAKDRSLMRMLRRISRNGCTVVLSTHCVEHLDLADQVLVLSSDGKLVRSGSPGEVMGAGEVSGWTDLLEAIAREQEPAEPISLITIPQTQLGRQATLVMRRGVHYALGVAVLPIGGAAVAGLAAPHGLRPGPAQSQAMAILVTVAALGGSALSYLEIVKDEGVRKRDWRAGAGSPRIVLSVAAVYALICALIAVVMTASFHLGRPGFPISFATPPIVAELLVVFGVLVSSMTIGLLISSSVAQTTHAVSANTIFAIAQVVLSGSLFEIPSWINWLTYVLPARLGFAAAASYGDLNGQPRGHAYADPLWIHTAHQFAVLLGGLAAVAAAGLVASVAILALRWRRDVE